MAERVLMSAKKREAKKENKVSQTKKTSPSQSISSPVEKILFLQRTIGNQAVGKLIKSGALQAKLRIGQQGDIYEQEADRVAEQVMRMPEQAIQRKEKKMNRPGSAGEIADIVTEIRQRRERRYEQLAQQYRSSLLAQAGISQKGQISNPQEAIKILQILKIDIKEMNAYVVRIRQAKASIMKGQVTDIDIRKKTEQAVTNLSQEGQSTFRKAIQSIRQEPFFELFLSLNNVSIIPDNEACRRYGGYLQKGEESEPIFGAQRTRRLSFIIHICKSIIEKGNVSKLRGLLSHELSHAIELEIAGRSTATIVTEPVIQELSHQLAQLPQYSGLEASLRQYLYEKIGGYPQSEIFAMLQQLPQSKHLQNDQLLAEVICELRRLDAARLPKDILRLLIKDLQNRTEILYDMRIQRSRGAEAQNLNSYKQIALKTLDQAMTVRELEKLGEPPYEIKCNF